MEATTRRLIIILSLICLPVAVSAREHLKLRSQDYMKYSRSVMAGARMGVAECDRQFKLDPWNCPLSDKTRRLPVFTKNRLLLANKETAFLHAVTTAGVMYSVIHNCSLGQLENCKCLNSAAARRKKSPPPSADWHWGGCSDNVPFGDLVARHFVDALEGRKGDGFDARRYMNLHNNRVGRKVVKATAKKVCKCHGQSSSCSVRTCMKKLGSFEKIGDVLKKKYQKALHVQYKNGSLYNDKNEIVTKRKMKLVYHDRSPDYCKANKLLNYPGVKGRVCEGEDGDLTKCRELCKSCGLKSKEVINTQIVKCNCKFVWCCLVSCETCTKKIITIKCV